MTRSVRLGLLLWGAIGVGAFGTACGSSSPRDKNFGNDAGSDFEAPVREVGTGNDGAGGEAGGGAGGGSAAGTSGSGGDSAGVAGTGAAAGSGGAAGSGASGNGGAAGASA